MSKSRKSMRRAAQTFNPLAENSWSKDDSKFGQRMLEKMGWKKGDGIGRHGQGIADNLKIRLKIDNKGLGYRIKEDEWVGVEVDFSDVLSKLNQSYAGTTSSISSLVSTSSSSRSRVHYHKFTRSKDISKYSKEDLSGILGRKEMDENICENDVPNESVLKVITNSSEKRHIEDNKKTFINDVNNSVNKSFKLDHEILMSKKMESSSANNLGSVDAEPVVLLTLENVDVPVGKKSKKRKLFANDDSDKPADVEEIRNENFNELESSLTNKSMKRKSRKKAVEHNWNSSPKINTEESSAVVAEITDLPPKKKKKKKVVESPSTSCIEKSSESVVFQKLGKNKPSGVEFYSDSNGCIEIDSSSEHSNGCIEIDSSSEHSNGCIEIDSSSEHSNVESQVGDKFLAKKNKKKRKVRLNNDESESEITESSSQTKNRRSSLDDFTNFMQKASDFNASNDVDEIMRKFEENKEILLKRYRDTYKRKYLESANECDSRIYEDLNVDELYELVSPHESQENIKKSSKNKSQKNIKNSSKNTRKTSRLLAPRKLTKAERIIQKAKLLKMIQTKSYSLLFKGSNLSNIAGYRSTS